MSNTITIFFTSKTSAGLFEIFIQQEMKLKNSIVKSYQRFSDKVGSKTIDVTLGDDAPNKAFKLGMKWENYYLKHSV